LVGWLVGCNWRLEETYVMRSFIICTLLQTSFDDQIKEGMLVGSCEKCIHNCGGKAFREEFTSKM